MKTLTLTIAALLLLFGVGSSRGANLTRISNATGVSVETLQAERASTGLGWGGAGACALTSERYRAKLRQHRRTSPVGTRLGKNCAR